MIRRRSLTKRIRAIAGSTILLLASTLTIFQVVTALGPNLVANPSAETGTTTTATGWTTNKWGTNTVTFTKKTDAHSGTYGLSTKMTARTSGDAKWYFTPVAVTPNTPYTFSNWYKSGVATSVDAEITATNGTVSYMWLGDPTASSTWKQNTYTFTTPANAAKVTIYHSIDKIGELIVDDYSLATTNGSTTPSTPTVSMTGPVNGATVSNTVALNATATDAQGIASVQFKVDGNNVGAADTTSPYSVSWDSKTVTNGSHTITAAATNTAGLSTTSGPVTITVNNTTVPSAPTVSITAPTAGATLANTTTITANASSTTAVANVQFKLDGTNLGAADTTSPYTYGWDTKTATNGQHTLTAVATDTSGQSTTSAPVTVNINNPITPPPSGNNLVPNPSFEASANGTSPDGWQAIQWGTNSSNFTYANTGHTGSRSGTVTTTAYSNGAANWYYAGVPVTGGKTYLFSDWYKSTVDTEVDAEVTMSDGTVQYFWLGNVSASSNWTQFKTTFTVPAGARSVTIYHILAKVGTLSTDDYSITEYTPLSFNRGIVSVTFDDGWANQYTTSRPTLNNLGLKATYYVLSGETNTPGYMNTTQIRSLYTEGNEIGSHTIDHTDLTTLTNAQVTAQMRDSQSTLQTIIGAPVTNFAYPYGAYNATTISIGNQYYASQRSVDRGFNSRDNLDVTKLKIQEVNSGTTQAQFQSWINDAIATKTWLILCYHEVTTSPAPGDEFYTVTPTNFTTQMNYLKNSGASVQTIKSALTEVKAQQ